MSPLALYVTVIAIVLVLAVALRFLILVPTRACIQCDKVVAVTAPSCRHCGHRYTAEDRELMRSRAEGRARQPAPEPAPMTSGPVAARPARPRTGVPRLECIRCGGEVALTALTCRHCGHRYSAAELARMRPVSNTRGR